MSKIVNWGHWIVTLLACAMAVESIWAVIHNTVSMGRGETFSPRLEATFLFVVLALISALWRMGDIQMALLGISSGARDLRRRVIYRNRGGNGW